MRLCCCRLPLLSPWLLLRLHRRRPRLLCLLLRCLLPLTLLRHLQLCQMLRLALLRQMLVRRLSTVRCSSALPALQNGSLGAGLWLSPLLTCWQAGGSANILLCCGLHILPRWLRRMLGCSCRWNFRLRSCSLRGRPVGPAASVRVLRRSRHHRRRVATHIRPPGGLCMWLRRWLRGWRVHC